MAFDRGNMAVYIQGDLIGICVPMTVQYGTDHLYTLVQFEYILVSGRKAKDDPQYQKYFKMKRLVS